MIPFLIFAVLHGDPSFFIVLPSARPMKTIDVHEKNIGELPDNFDSTVETLEIFNPSMDVIDGRRYTNKKEDRYLGRFPYPLPMQVSLSVSPGRKSGLSPNIPSSSDNFPQTMTDNHRRFLLKQTSSGHSVIRTDEEGASSMTKHSAEKIKEEDIGRKYEKNGLLEFIIFLLAITVVASVVSAVRMWTSKMNEHTKCYRRLSRELGIFHV